MPSLASTYARVGAETGTTDASPHKLIAMLFDGFDDALARARGALASGQVEAKCRAISHAVRIVEEGLRAGLDMKSGGALAADLSTLYTYVSLRLTQANLHNDPAALDECAQLLAPVRSAWTDIAPRVHAAAR